MKPRAHAYWAVLLSFALAALLQIVALPIWAQWWRPQCLALVLIYWVMALPHRVGLTTAFLVGLFYDLLCGAVLGQHALGLVLVAYGAGLLYQRLRLFALWQQGVVVLLLMMIYQLTGHWVQSLSGRGAQSLHFLLPVLSSALIWPFVFVTLRSFRRRFEVI